MPLLEERSQLTNWHTVDTSDKYADKLDIVGEHKVPDPVNTAQSSQGVNYFIDLHATGFIIKRKYPDTDFILNDFGGPAIPQTLYLDSKGDFSSLYTMFNRAEPVFRVGSPDPGSPMENRPLVNPDGTPINSLFNRASTPNRMGFSFIPEFGDTNRYPTTRPTITEQSRIYFKHTTNKSGIDNAGFTRPGIGLSNYYDQLIKDRGILGIRNDKVNQPLGFEQPFIVREIGQKWGIDRFTETPSGLGDVIRIGLNVLDNLGGAIFGRDPSVFADRYLADITRLSKAANPALSIFALKQTELQKRNAFDAVTTAKYGLADASTISIFDDQSPISALIDGTKLALDPQIYNPLSIYGPLSFNRMGFIDTSKLRSIAAQYAVGILKNVSERALKEATAVGTRFIESITPHSLHQIQSFGGNVIKGLKRSKFFKAVDQNIQSVQTFVGDTRDFVEQKSQGFRDTAAAIVGDLSFAYGEVGKSKLQQLDKTAYEDVKTDKVNLIPYGSAKYIKEVRGEDLISDHKKLDFIPFKFYDSFKDRHIVFRAILSGITDTFTPDYAEERYVGRPDSVYVYQGTKRDIGFTFDVYPKSDAELVTLWEKLNYLAGLTYPHWTDAAGGGKGMITPFCQLTIGNMYTDTPGYISALTYTVMDTGTWEVDWAKLPKYIQVNCTFVYIGRRLPSATQKHYELEWVGDEVYVQGKSQDWISQKGLGLGREALGKRFDLGDTVKKGLNVAANFLNFT